jgi:hypothetical protein
MLETWGIKIEMIYAHIFHISFWSRNFDKIHH